MTEYGKKKQQIELPPLPIIAIAMIIIAGIASIAGITLYATQSSSQSLGPNQPISPIPTAILSEKNYCDNACDATPKVQGLYRLEKKIGPYNLLPYKETEGYPPRYTKETRTFQLFGREGKEHYLYWSIDEILDYCSNDIDNKGMVLLRGCKDDIIKLVRDEENEYLKKVIVNPEVEGKQVINFTKIATNK